MVDDISFERTSDALFRATGILRSIVGWDDPETWLSSRDDLLSAIDDANISREDLDGLVDEMKSTDNPDVRERNDFLMRLCHIHDDEINDFARMGEDDMRFEDEEEQEPTYDYRDEEFEEEPDVQYARHFSSDAYDDEMNEGLLDSIGANLGRFGLDKVTGGAYSDWNYRQRERERQQRQSEWFSEHPYVLAAIAGGVGLLIIYGLYKNKVTHVQEQQQNMGQSDQTAGDPSLSKFTLTDTPAGETQKKTMQMVGMTDDGGMTFADERGWMYGSFRDSEGGLHTFQLPQISSDASSGKRRDFKDLSEDEKKSMFDGLFSNSLMDNLIIPEYEDASKSVDTDHGGTFKPIPSPQNVTEELGKQMLWTTATSDNDKQYILDIYSRVRGQ